VAEPRAKLVIQGLRDGDAEGRSESQSCSATGFAGAVHAVAAHISEFRRAAVG
jgi:hypothetical protein